MEQNELSSSDGIIRVDHKDRQKGPKVRTCLLDQWDILNFMKQVLLAQWNVAVIYETYDNFTQTLI